MKINFAYIFNVLLIGNVDTSTSMLQNQAVIKAYYESYMAY